MPLSALDPTPALIVVDLQRGVVGIPAAHPIDGVIATAADLAAAFRRHELPVVLVQVAGGAPGREPPAPAVDWMELVDELDVSPNDIRVVKRTWGAFTGTDLDETLRALGVTQVVLAGVSTSAGVESTARAAHELGYSVVLATDAMTDSSAEVHENSVQRIFPRLGETTTSSAVVSELDRLRP